MEIGSRKGSIMGRAGVTALTFTALAIVAMIAAPLSLEAPYLGILVTGSDSAGAVFGSFAVALLLFGALAHAIVRAAINRWPGRERSVRIGVLAVPVVVLGLLSVPETVNEHLAAMATISLPAVFAVAMGAATAWIGRPRPQRSPSSVPSPLSNEPAR